jgi:DNA invertase Pin-like site-specific DNA recombinase
MRPENYDGAPAQIVIQVIYLETPTNASRGDVARRGGLQRPAPRSRPGSSSRRIGYARVSTKTQELDRQIRALKAERCDEILKDTASGKSLAGRPQLRKALDGLAPGDELVIAEWDRVTRSMWDGLQILKEIIDAEATIRVLDRAYIDLTSPIGRGFMAFISAMAEDERLRIIKRTHEGRAIARENSVKMGRKFRLNDVQRTEARERLANGEAASHLARVYGVSRATIYRV